MSWKNTNMKYRKNYVPVVVKIDIRTIGSRKKEIQSTNQKLKIGISNWNSIIDGNALIVLIPGRVNFDLVKRSESFWIKKRVYTVM